MYEWEHDDEARGVRWGSRGGKGLVNDYRFLPVQRLCYC